MELTTIDMPPDTARQHFLEYRRAVRERHNEEDRLIMAGYRELSRGRRLIRLSETIAAGGTTTVLDRPWSGAVEKEILLPRLAIMRADQPECWVETEESGRIDYNPTQRYGGRKYRVVVPAGLVDGLSRVFRQYRAMVPPVPPAFRPSIHLRNFHILWEAEWQRAGNLRPPGDPALLRHVGGDLYAVLAVWDLTEVERAVLFGRGR